jgi:hypothetical protein
VGRTAADKIVQAVLWKRIDQTVGNALLDIAPASGTGQGAKHIPFSYRLPFDRFLQNSTSVQGVNPTYQVAVESPGGIQRVITVGYEERGQKQVRREWRIPRQHEAATRPHAWNPGDQLPKTLAAITHNWYLLLVRIADGSFHARAVTRQAVQQMPAAVRNAILGADQDLLFIDSGSAAMMKLAHAIFGALRKQPCVLVYGPPGTGKTVAMQQVRAFLADPATFPTIGFDPAQANQPFTETAPDLTGLPTNRKFWWVTFHQSVGYEDFVLGLRPKPGGPAGITLEPRAGVLLEAMEHARAANSMSVILIDEINRGNASRVFGDFITFMENDKRLKPDGTVDAVQTIPLTFPSLDQDPAAAKKSIVVRFADGPSKQLALPFHVPRHVYLIGSMNSLDRSVAPLDTALARRFRRVEAKVDYTELTTHLTARTGNPEFAAVASALLKRVNRRLIGDFGEDFQLGPAYFWEAHGADEAASYSALASAWDEMLLPQIRELYRNRPGELAGLLLGEEEVADWPYKFEEAEGGVRYLAEATALASLTPGRRAEVVKQLASIAPTAEAEGEGGEEDDEQ